VGVPHVVLQLLRNGLAKLPVLAELDLDDHPNDRFISRDHSRERVANQVRMVASVVRRQYTLISEEAAATNDFGVADSSP